MKTLEGILAKTDVDGGEGKVSCPFPTLRSKLITSEIRYRRNVQKWMKKSLSSLVSRELFSRMSFSVIRRNRIGLYRNLLL
jgi:hypothetical protein